MVAIVEEVIGESAARQVGSTSTSGKLPEKTPIARRHNRKKAKDKPKRPMSAYNFFFKAERERIIKLLAGNEDVENIPESFDFIDEESLNRLRRDGKDSSKKAPKFEELGKLIGSRWKALPPDRLTKYSELATEDAERYKKQMAQYNERQEGIRKQELANSKAIAASYGSPSIMSSPHAEGDRVTMTSPYDMPSYGGIYASYSSMDPYAHPTGLSMTMGYTSYAPYGAAGSSMMPPESSSSPPYEASGGGPTLYGSTGANYGAPLSYPPSSDPSLQGMYGSYSGWNGQQ